MYFYPRPNDGVSAERYCDGEQLFIFIICFSVGGVGFYNSTNAYI